MKEESGVFENRKKDHIRIALSKEAQASVGTGLDLIHLSHEALPDIDFSEVKIENDFLGKEKSSLFVSSMTAGHQEGVELNIRIAEACSERNWLMGVGSQRKQLDDPQAREEWALIRERVPNVTMLGNIGITQLIHTSTDQIKGLVKSLNAAALIVHTNPLQEVFQPEGTPQFKGSLDALKQTIEECDVPVILKETGCGFSRKTLGRVNGLGLYAVDVAGLGGTHWGLVEGEREQIVPSRRASAHHFSAWGETTVSSLLTAVGLDPDYKVWASGGVRSGLDAAKLLAMGGEMVGFAKPIMIAALKSKSAVVDVMEQLEFELKSAMFCTGAKDLKELKCPTNWCES